ncbi:MAG: cytochrome b [Rickettsiales bacterium]|nr:cytochrome b [Rickettsiales bacterium]
MNESTPTRYHSAAIVLHWLMAIGFLLMLGSGITMSYIELEKSLTFKLYQWHKSGGVILLCAAALRLLVRLITHTPDIPAYLQGLERLAVKAGHWGLYAIMILMPLSGWVMVSSSPFGLPTIVFGWFEWPHIPTITSDDKAIYQASNSAHFYLAILFGLMIIGHVGAVIKHRIIDKHNLLTRMWWSKA